MRIFSRMIVCAAAALLLSTILFYFADAWSGEKTSALQAARKLVLESRRNQALSARAEEISHSLTIKRAIIAQLVAGRLHLREAISQFHKANEMIENMDLDLVPPYQRPTDSAGVGRQVLLWVRNEITSWPPEKARPLLADLESEYQKLFGRPSLPAEPYSSI